MHISDENRLSKMRCSFALVFQVDQQSRKIKSQNKNIHLFTTTCVCYV